MVASLRAYDADLAVIPFLAGTREGNPAPR